MSVLTRFVKRLAGRVSRAAKVARRSVRASYDSAQTTGENENHWYWADSLNANASNSPEVRKTLRDRSRYETENNGYLGGLVDKLGKDLVGRGPRVQLRIPGTDRKVCRGIEAAFQKWARAVGLGQKLRLLDNMAVRDGEGFGLLVNNPRLDPHGVQLDLRLYETDQVSTPFMPWGDPLAFDGGRLDELGNVTEWHFLKAHPGSNVWLMNFLDADTIDARDVIHWYTPKRAGQVRGVPETQSSLTLFAYLRRYTLAVVTAAETAANLAGVMETDGSAADAPAPTVATMDEVNLARGALLTLPAGWKATQFRPEQPTNTYAAFKTEILTEAGQPVGAPQNVSTGSSAAYNYSSGRLDHGIYQRGVGVRRSDLRDRVLDQIFRAWLDEAALVPDLIPAGLPLRHLWAWDWYFDGFTSLDPQKDALTEETRLRAGTTTLAEIFAERGLDWEEQLEQQAVEAARKQELRRPVAGATPAPAATAPASGSAPAGGNQPDTAKEAAKQGDVQSAALKGAQIASLLLIIDKVTTGTVPPAAAAAIIGASFPLMDKAVIQSIVNALEVAPEPEAANAA